MEIEKKFVNHILLRYPNDLAPSCKTISTHNQIIKSQDYVFMGEYGKPISSHCINLLEQQILSLESKFQLMEEDYA
jgi:hypothetical protein